MYFGFTDFCKAETSYPYSPLRTDSINRFLLPSLKCTQTHFIFRIRNLQRVTKDKDIDRISYVFLDIDFSLLCLELEILICLAGLTAVIQRALTPPCRTPMGIPRGRADGFLLILEPMEGYLLILERPRSNTWHKNTKRTLKRPLLEPKYRNTKQQGIC